MSRKKRFKDDEDESEEMSLQITSMADIFTIILVFLLKSYSTGLVSFSLAQNLMLPEARAETQSRDVPKVQIVRDAVLVEQVAAEPLRDFNFIKPNPGGGADPIYRALMRQRKGQSGKADSQLFILADRKTPYATLKAVMSSAASAGYVDLKLAVVQPN